jgi:hypothetical protein
VNHRVTSACFVRCFVYSLAALLPVLALVWVGAGLADADLPPLSASTLLATVVFVASVATGVVLVCGVFYFIERATRPLFP